MWWDYLSVDPRRHLVSKFFAYSIYVKYGSYWFGSKEYLEIVDIYLIYAIYYI